MEEYQFIMKNDVWDIVLRFEQKSIVTSKWIYKIKHTTDRSIEKHYCATYMCNIMHLLLINLGFIINIVTRHH
jgi:hypothetical protein